MELYGWPAPRRLVNPNGTPRIKVETPSGELRTPSFVKLASCVERTEECWKDELIGGLKADSKLARGSPILGGLGWPRIIGDRAEFNAFK